MKLTNFVHFPFVRLVRSFGFAREKGRKGRNVNYVPKSKNKKNEQYLPSLFVYSFVCCPFKKTVNVKKKNKKVKKIKIIKLNFTFF
jgi:hypothetical protein